MGTLFSVTLRPTSQQGGGQQRPEDAKVVAAPLPYYAGYPYAGYGYAGYPSAGYGYAGLPYAAGHVTYAAAPAVAASVAPVAYAAPIAPYVGSQYHAQDEFGNLNYGYSNLNSAKAEAGNTYGGVNGGYSYVDANGVLQQVQYVADAAGFRVADSRLPVAPVYNGVAPVAPVDTAEVAEAFAEAYAAQEAAVAAVAERKKRSAEPGFAYGFNTHHPIAYSGYPYAGLAATHPYAAAYAGHGYTYGGVGHFLG